MAKHFETLKQLPKEVPIYEFMSNNYNAQDFLENTIEKAEKGYYYMDEKPDEKTLIDYLSESRKRGRLITPHETTAIEDPYSISIARDIKDYSFKFINCFNQSGMRIVICSDIEIVDKMMYFQDGINTKTRILFDYSPELISFLKSNSTEITFQSSLFMMDTVFSFIEYSAIIHARDKVKSKG